MACPRALLALIVLTVATLVDPARADTADVAPVLLDDAVEAVASTELSDLVASLPPGEQAALQGVYLAIERNRADVVAMPACDDDGDYVVVLSRGLLELVENVAYADASDRLRGTHALPSYGLLLARAQRIDTPPLPVPSPSTAPDASLAMSAVADAFVSDALAWIVADEFAHAILGSFTCPSPTATHEQGDDTWTTEEHAIALRLAPRRMDRLAEADEWATRQLLARGGSAIPAVEILRALAPLENARSPGAANAYLTLHPRALARASAARELAARETATPSRGMR